MAQMGPEEGKPFSCANRIVKRAVSIPALHLPIPSLLVRLQKCQSSPVFERKKALPSLNIGQSIIVGICAAGILLQKGSELSLGSQKV